MQIFEERQYQTETVDSWYNVIVGEPDKKPVVAVPTGAGKTVIMSNLIKKYLDKFPHNQVLVLSHTQEIVQQDYEALTSILDTEVGIYSAGLGSKKVRQVTVGGIQTVYRSAKKFKFFNLIIVDECHAVNHKNSGMYRTLFESCPGIVTGMSATIFRSGHGYLTDPGGLFDTIAYDLTKLHKFNELVKQGYLTNLIAVAPELQLDTSQVKKTAGDYNSKDMSEKFDRMSITKKAVDEVLYYGKNSKKWLLFAIDIDHCENIHQMLSARGIKTKVLHSKMSHDRAETISAFKDGDTQALVSVGMVTTGFDAPNVDLIVLLRPTMSAVLHVQMVGRGLRISPGKEHCLVLDFAGNTERLGPINDVQVPKKGKKGKGKPMVKKCANCSTLVPIVLKQCPTCGYKFPVKEKISVKASTEEIIRKNDDPSQKIKWLDVKDVKYSVHRKMGKPNSLKVTYICGLQTIQEWVCCNHDGYAKRKADHWSKVRGHTGRCTTEEVFNNRDHLIKPLKIQVDFNDKYPAIKNSLF